MFDWLALAFFVGSVGLTAYQMDRERKMYNQAQNEAEKIADMNAQLAIEEAEEEARRAQEDADRELAEAQARQKAYGMYGESAEMWLQELESTRQEEIDWIRYSGIRQSQIAKQGGEVAKSQITDKTYGTLASGMGSAFNYYSAM